jgi:folate-dependent phosphoribosylglycinamide formyltransferase PurN
MKPKRVILLSPNPYSLYTLATLVLLTRAGTEVAGIGFRRLMNPSRVLFEGRRDGARLIKKVCRKLLWRRLADGGSARNSLSAFLAESSIQRESVPALCRRNGIPIRYCYDFNDADFVAWVKASSAQAIVFTGGGLLRQPLLDATPKGVLNCHMGILPRYRGMDLPEWALLCGDADSTGCCVHLMDSGVDTGPILMNHFVPPRTGDTVSRLRGRIEYQMPSVLVSATVGYLEDAIALRPQSPEDGKQFFIMSPALREVVEYRLSRRTISTAQTSR